MIPRVLPTQLHTQSSFRGTPVTQHYREHQRVGAVYLQRFAPQVLTLIMYDIRLSALEHILADESSSTVVFVWRYSTVHKLCMRVILFVVDCTIENSVWMRENDNRSEEFLLLILIVRTLTDFGLSGLVRATFRAC